MSLCSLKMATIMQNRMVKIQNLIDKRQHIRNVENYISNDDKSLVKKVYHT